jgi:hypothetical protein
MRRLKIAANSEVTAEPEISNKGEQPVIIKLVRVVGSNITDGSENSSQGKISLTAKENESPPSDFIAEVRINLAIATMPWTGKPLPFQTACWDIKQNTNGSFFTNHLKEWIQVYADISLANNIVWMATEIGHRSHELDESYLKLCGSIAEGIKAVMPPVTGQGYQSSAPNKTSNNPIDSTVSNTPGQQVKDRPVEKIKSEKSQNKSTADDLLELFTENKVEESQVSVLASRLKDIDTNEILEQSRQIIKQLKKNTS